MGGECRCMATIGGIRSTCHKRDVNRAEIIYQVISKSQSMYMLCFISLSHRTLRKDI